MARTTRGDLVAAVLTILSATNAGASNIHEQLLGQGFRVSEPTVARLLRELDRLGYTAPSGRLGRVLTAKGRTQLVRMRDTGSRTGYAQQIVEQLRDDNLADVVNILIARRGIEREIALAAATNATKSDLAALQARYAAVRRGETSADMHDVLAQAAHNPVLESLYRALTQDPGVTRLLHQLAEWRGKIVDLPFDRGVIDAIARHDGAKAEQLVVAHVDALLKMVTEFWHETRTQKTGRNLIRRQATARAQPLRSRSTV